MRFSSPPMIHRCGLLFAVLFGLVLLASPSSSQAAEEPFKIDFDKSEMQIGLIRDLPLGEVASTGSINGTIDESGNVTIPKDGFVLPQLGITTPINMKVFMGIESAATGTFDRVTGDLELKAKAGVWLSVNLPELLAALEGLGIDATGQLEPLSSVIGGIGDLTCGFSPMDVTFTTGSNSLGSGRPFTEGPLGQGAITAEWSQLGPFAGKTKILIFDVCQMIKQYAPQLLQGAVGSSLPSGIDLGGLDIETLLSNLDNVNLGPSSLTLERTVDESTTPPVGKPSKGAHLKLTVTPKKSRIKAGKKAVFVVKVKNTGQQAARSVRVCLRTKRAKVLNGNRCRRLGKVMSGATQTRRFRLKAGRGRSKLKVSFEARSTNASRSTSAARLLIRTR